MKIAKYKNYVTYKKLQLDNRPPKKIILNIIIDINGQEFKKIIVIYYCK